MSSKRDIFKVLVPVNITSSSPFAIIYNESRSVNRLVDVDDKLRKAMHGDFKLYFDAQFISNPETKKEDFVIYQEVGKPTRDW